MAPGTRLSPGMGLACGRGLGRGRGFYAGGGAHRTMGRCLPQGTGRSWNGRWAGPGLSGRGALGGVACGTGRGLSSGKKIGAVGGATANSNLTRGGASRLLESPRTSPTTVQGPVTHLLLVGPLLAGPGALAALLLDSHHEAPMLSRSLAARRPGATGRQGHPQPHLHPRPRSWHGGGLRPGSRGLRGSLSAGRGRSTRGADRDPWEELRRGVGGEEAAGEGPAPAVWGVKTLGGRGASSSDRAGGGWAVAPSGLGEGMSHSRGGRAGLLGAVGHGRSRPHLEGRRVAE